MPVSGIGEGFARFGQSFSQSFGQAQALKNKKEAQERQDEINQRQIELQEKKFVVKDIPDGIRNFRRLSPESRKAMSPAFIKSLGLDPKSEEGKAYQNFLANAPDEELDLMATAIAKSGAVNKEEAAAFISNNFITTLNQLIETGAEQQKLQNRRDILGGGTLSQTLGQRTPSQPSAAGETTPPTGGTGVAPSGATGGGARGQVQALRNKARLLQSIGDDTAAGQLLKEANDLEQSSPEIQSELSAAKTRGREQAEAVSEFTTPISPRNIQAFKEFTQEGTDINIGETQTDLLDKGLRIPTNPAELKELANSMSSVRKAVSVAENVMGLIGDTSLNSKPQVLGLFGQIGGAVQSVGSFIEGGINILGSAGEILNSQEQVDVYRQAADDALGKSGLIERLEVTGLEAAKIRSAVINLAFTAAAALDQTGRSVSDRDVVRFITEIGGSTGSADQFRGVLRAFIMRMGVNAGSKVKAVFGANATPRVGKIAIAPIFEMSNSDLINLSPVLLPDTLHDQRVRELERRINSGDITEEESELLRSVTTRQRAR